MKKHYPILSVSLIVSILLVLASSAFADNFQLRNGVLFGDSIDTVKSKETLPLDYVSSDNTEYRYEGTIAGMEGEVTYYFDKESGKLADMVYAFSSSKYKDVSDDDYNKLKQSLDGKYGDPLEKRKSFSIFGKAYYELAKLKVVMEYIGGRAGIRNTDEWIITCENYYVKIDLINGYSYTSSTGYSYINFLSYHYFTDEDLSKIQQEKDNEKQALENDL